MSLNPQIIIKEEKKEFVVLPYDEFVALQSALEDYEDLKALREAKAESVSEDTVPYSSVRKELLED